MFWHVKFFLFLKGVKGATVVNFCKELFIFKLIPPLKKE